LIPIQVFSLLYVLSIRLLRRFLFPQKEYRELMEKLSETNKAFMKAAKEGNVEEMERINKERIALMQGPYVKVMGKQIPYLIGVFGLLYLFKHILPYAAEPSPIVLPFTIPIINLSVIEGAFGIFIFYAILFSLLLSLAEKLWKRLKSRGNEDGR